MSLLPAAPVSAGRKEEKWFLKKTCGDSRRADLPALLGNRSQPEGTRKSGSLEKSAPTPAGATSWLPRRRSEPEGTEEKWFRQETVQRPCGLCPLSSADASLNRGNEENWFRRERSRLAANVTGGEPKGMRKSGSAKQMYLDDCSSLNWKVFRRARNKAVLAKDREVEEPSETILP